MLIGYFELKMVQLNCRKPLITAEVMLVEI